MRKVFQPLYNPGVVHIYTSTMNDKISNFVDKMNDLIDGPEFDAWDYLPHLSLDIIMSMRSFVVHYSMECLKTFVFNFNMAHILYLHNKHFRDSNERRSKLGR